MSDLFLLSVAQMQRIAPFFPFSLGVPRVDDRRMISGIVYVIRRGLQWKDAPHGYGPHNTLYSTHLKAHRTAASLLKGGISPLHRPHQGGLNAKLHAVCDGQGRLLDLTLSEGQLSDHSGARLLLSRLPAKRASIAARGYDSNRFGAALTERGITPCILSTRSRRTPLPYDADLYRQRHRVESMFGRSRTGAASLPATTAVPTPSSPPSSSPLPSPSRSANES